MIKQISENVWKFYYKEFGSNVYLIKLKEKTILIDTSSFKNRESLVADLEKLNIKPSEINFLILTHNHWDHIQNIDLFSQAKIYGNKKDFPDKEIKDIIKIQIKELQIIEAPGHTQGSTCILYKNILFSGDVIFDFGIGRTDFPESSPEQMQKSLEKLKQIKYEILCAGH